MIKFSKKNNKSGQMLMEAIVAINLVLIGLLGIISLLVKSSHTNRELGTSLTATYLAAEGVEIIKNIIDTDVAAPGIVWNTSVEINKSYEVDFLTMGKLKALEGDPLTPLNIDEATGKYSYGSGTPTVFKRKVKVSSVSGGDYKYPPDKDFSDDVMRVESFVSIGAVTCDTSTTEKQEGCVRIQDEFYNWRKGTTK